MRMSRPHDKQVSGTNKVLLMRTEGAGCMTENLQGGNCLFHGHVIVTYAGNEDT